MAAISPDVMFERRSAVGRAFGIVETYGLRRGGRAVARRVAGRIYDHASYTVLAKALLRDGPPTRPSPDERMEVRRATTDEVLAQATRHAARRRALAYLARGYECAIGLVNGDAAASCWWADDSVAHHDQLRFFDVALRSGDAWCFDNHLRASYRGNGRAARFLRELEGLLSRRGYDRMLGYVDAGNLPARWTYETSGWRPIRTTEARYILHLVGMSEGRLLVRTSGWSAPTFSYRPIGPRRRRPAPT